MFNPPFLFGINATYLARITTGFLVYCFIFAPAYIIMFSTYFLQVFLKMKRYKSCFFALIIPLYFLSCGKNNETETEVLPLTNPSEIQQNNSIKTVKKSNISDFEKPQDSIKAVKESVFRTKKYKKKHETKVPETKDLELANSETSSKKIVPTSNTNIPTFVYIKKILLECKIGVPMTQKDLETNYDIPKEGVQLVKSITKISNDELDIKWKSTWLIEKLSDAKFKDGRLKVRFENNKMFTSGDAIAIKYDKKLYTDLYMIGRAAYIPTVKGFYWQIGKD